MRTPGFSANTRPCHSFRSLGVWKASAEINIGLSSGGENATHFVHFGRFWPIFTDPKPVLRPAESLPSALFALGKERCQRFLGLGGVPQADQMAPLGVQRGLISLGQTEIESFQDRRGLLGNR